LAGERSAGSARPGARVQHEHLLELRRIDVHGPQALGQLEAQGDLRGKMRAQQLLQARRIV